MRTLKYAILGLLNRKPMSGYDLSKEFDRDLAKFWSASHSQIYPELRKLSGERLVSFDTEIHGEKLEVKLYSITEAGREDYLQWLRRDEPLEPTPREIFRLKTYLSDGLTEQELYNMLRSQMRKRKVKLKGLEAAYSQLYLGKNLKQLDKAARGDYMTLNCGILRERAYLDWLRQCMELLEPEE